MGGRIQGLLTACPFASIWNDISISRYQNLPRSARPGGTLLPGVSDCAQVQPFSGRVRRVQRGVFLTGGNEPVPTIASRRKEARERRPRCARGVLWGAAGSLPRCTGVGAGRWLSGLRCGLGDFGHGHRDARPGPPPEDTGWRGERAKGLFRS